MSFGGNGSLGGGTFNLPGEVTGSGANNRITLWTGAQTVGSDASGTWTGTGDTFVLGAPTFDASWGHFTGPAGASFGASQAGGGFTNQPATDTITLVSSDAGDTTQQATLIGTTAGGADQYINITLNGVTPVTTGVTWDKLLAVSLNGACAGTVTITETSGGLTITTLAPAVLSAGLQTFAAVPGYGRVLQLVASGATTKTVGVGGYAIGGATQRDPVVLTGTTTVNTALTWNSAVQFYLGDLENTRTVTINSIAGFDFNGTLSSPGAGASSERFGSGSTAAGDKCVVVGNGASSAGGFSAVVGYGSSAAGAGGVAVGYQATASGNQGIAIGNGPTASSTDTVAIGRGTTSSGSASVGVGAAVTSSNSVTVAIGSASGATGFGGIAIGGSAAVAGNFGVAIGYQSTVAGNASSIALGYLATNTAANQLMIGSATSPVSSTVITVGSGGQTVRVGGTVKAAAPGTTTTGTSEEVLATVSLPAGFLSTNGDSLDIQYYAHTANTANNKRMRIRIGGISGVVTYDSGLLSSQDEGWYGLGPLHLVRRSSTTGTYSFYGYKGNAAVAQIAGNIAGTPSITWANALDIVFTAETPTAAGDFTLDTYSVVYNPAN